MAESPLSPPSKKKKHQQVHTGGTLQAHVVSLARGDVPPTPGCGDENISTNQTWERRPINKSSETAAWQKQSVNVPEKGASM